MSAAAPTDPKKTVLIVSGGAEGLRATRRAKELGYYVVVADRDVQAPAFAYADSCLIADASSTDETPAAAERFSRKIRRIDGVIGAEFGAAAAAAGTSERLGLAGASREAARVTTDRLLIYERLLAAGVPIPWFSPVATPQALHRIAIEHGADLVVRPADGRGNEGAQYPSHAEDLDRAFNIACRHSRTKRVMAEEHLQGPKLTAASAIADGRCHTLAFADRTTSEKERAPFPIEDGADMPSAVAPEVLARASEIIAQAIAALGIGPAAAQTELAVAGEKAYVVGIGSGLPDYVWARQIALSTGVDFYTAAMKAAMGEALTPEELMPTAARPVTSRVLFAPPGRIARIVGEERARAVPGVEELAILALSGDIARPNEPPLPAAMVLATGTSREASVCAAQQALSLLRVESF